jgi:hypothetical protein
MIKQVKLSCWSILILLNMLIFQFSTTHGGITLSEVPSFPMYYSRYLDRSITLNGEN